MSWHLQIFKGPKRGSAKLQLYTNTNTDTCNKKRKEHRVEKLLNGTTQIRYLWSEIATLNKPPQMSNV
jgi:hypothetical protein